MAAVLAGISAIGSIMGGSAKKRAARKQAQQLLEEGKGRARAIRKRAGYATSAARAGFAASGVDVNEGTAALVPDQMVRDSEQDAMAEILSAQRGAGSVRAEGNAAFTSGLFDAAASGLSGWIAAKKPKV